MPLLKQYRIYVLFSLILATWVVMVAVTLHRNAAETDKALIAVSQSSLIIGKNQQLAIFIERMLASRRGHILSGLPALAARYEESKAAASDLIAELSDLVRDDSAQVARLNEMQHHFLNLTEKIEAVEPMPAPGKSIAWNPAPGGEQALNIIRTDLIRVSQDTLLDAQHMMDARMRDLGAVQAGGATALVTTDILFVLLLAGLGAYAFNQRPQDRPPPDVAQEIYRLASEGSADGVFKWNLVRDRAFYSPQFWSMLGYQPDRFPDTMQSFKDLLHPEDKPRVLELIDKYVGGEVSEYNTVFRMKHHTGRWVWINARGRALYDAAGKPTRVVGVHTDISHLKAQEEKLRQAKEYAESANLAKTDFLAHMSHEIRTPLTAISGIAEIFETALDGLDDKQRQLVKVLSSSTSSLKELVSDILDFSRIESGEIEMDEKSFGLKNLFDQVVSIVSVRAGEKSLDLSFDYSDVQRLKFLGDRARLRQILLNLVGNAIKFTDRGSVAVTARKIDTVGGALLSIEIRDSGIGIDAQNFDMIFERFKQADSSVSRRYGGSGLGLPISLRLARLMGGDITVESAVGQGATFTLTLPLKTQEMQDEQETDQKLSRTLSESIRGQALGSKDILLVEDYEGNIVLLTYLLESLQFNYDVARTGLEALNMWKEKRYDLILMDVQMPEMDGFTATAQIRHMEKEKDMPRTPIIGMTAHALVGDREKCIEAGMDAYLPKPIVELDLKARIIEFLSEGKKAA